MKHGKKLTVAMKKLLVKNNLDPKQYLYVSNTTDCLTVVNIKTNELLVFKN
ncbi:DUF6906 family protein [Thomasclavelia cocleata]|uniref:DUF6906 family protein n=1 Tax=Thomasclavelia cocleata TaxID=69824 RepID=UPI00242EB595|nr:hypothetical protein [Thomasclavelia cocleata]